MRIIFGCVAVGWFLVLVMKMFLVNMITPGYLFCIMHLSCFSYDIMWEKVLNQTCLSVPNFDLKDKIGKFFQRKLSNNEFLEYRWLTPQKLSHKKYKLCVILDMGILYLSHFLLVSRCSLLN